MIHVVPKLEPPDFDRLVRKPGLKYLVKKPKPDASGWKNHDYWREILKDLRKSYNEICAYSCHWIPADTGSSTVEHFLPKSKYPQKAYEWSNYRLVYATLNGRKGNREDILDPFAIEDGWFIIEFPSLLVKPSSLVDDNCANKIKVTIECLGLNDEGTCLKSRERYIKDYCLEEINFHHLCKAAPFIAKELTRQNLVDSIKQMMVYSQDYD